MGRRSAYRRGRPRKKSKAAWIVGGVALVVATLAGGWWAMRPSPNGGADIRQVAKIFDDAWNDGDLSALAGMHHPDGAAAFRARLDLVAEKRWPDGFPPILESEATEKDRAAREADSPQTATALSAHKLEHGAILVNWQFDQGQQRRFIYDLDLPLPDLMTRLADFGSAWSRSDPRALHPFFRLGSEEKMAAVVEREARERGWSARFPAIGRARLDPELALLARLVALGMSTPKIDAHFELPEAELMVRWKVGKNGDDWYISGFRFP